MKNKTVIAHRGMKTLAPENTIAAFNLCKKYNVKWIECDVDIIYDDTLIIIHDSTFDRCTNSFGSIYSHSSKNLFSINAGSWFSSEFQNEGIPTLNKIINLVNKQKFFLNLKIRSNDFSVERIHRLIELVSNELEKLYIDCELIVSCYNPVLLYDFKKLNSHIETALIIQQNAFYSDSPIIASYIGAEYIHLFDTDINQRRVDFLLNHNLEINIREVDSIDRANQLFNWGVKGILTDYAQNIIQSFPYIQ